MLRCDALDKVVVEEVLRALVGTKFDVTLRAEGRVGGDRNTEGLAELHERFLRQVWVKLDLVDRGRVASITENVEEEGALAVSVV